MPIPKKRSSPQGKCPRGNNFFQAGWVIILPNYLEVVILFVRLEWIKPTEVEPAVELNAHNNNSNKDQKTPVDESSSNAEQPEHYLTCWREYQQ